MSNCEIVPLTHRYAFQNAETLAAIANQIPGVPYTQWDITAIRKNDRRFYGKWDHSLIALSYGQPVGIALGYERERESTDQYPQHTLYLSELAVSASFQRRGVGRELLGNFLEYGRETGMKWLPAELNFSVQTNQAASNKHVLDLYLAHRFRPRATKQYPDRTDVVLGRPA
jgi:ribosomal protein S18 acetylase RimI-like enzyme